MRTPIDRAGMLAHLRNRFRVGPENLATEALAYILNNYPGASDAFLRHARLYLSEIPSIARYETQNWSTQDSGIPDLVGVAEAGQTPLIVEVKFQAGLTDNQPTTYLERLVESGAPGLLLFLVPRGRADSVWKELRRRCIAGGYALDEVADGPDLRVGAHRHVKIGVARWSDVLDALDDRLASDPAGVAELRQLRSLCEYQDSQIFEPLDSADVDGRIGRRILEYRDLIFEAVRVLVDAGLADIKGLNRAYSTVHLGRWLRLEGWNCGLLMRWRWWAHYEPQTPIWLWIYDQRGNSYAPLSDALYGLADRGDLLSAEGRPLIPIHLPLNEDRDTVLRAIVSQLEDVAGLLKTCPPPSVDQEVAPPGDDPDGEDTVS